MRATHSLALWVFFAFTILASILVAVVKAQSSPALPLIGKGQGLYSGNLEGLVVDKKSGLPIADARVTIIELNLATTSDPLGRFAWKNLPMTGSVMPVTVSVTATGLGEWTIKDVRLVAADTLILKPRLTKAPYLDVVPPPRAKLADLYQDIQGSIQALGALSSHSADAPLP